MKIRAILLILAAAVIFTTSIAFAQIPTPGCADYSYYLGWRARDMPPYDPLGWAPSVLGLQVVGNLAYVSPPVTAWPSIM